MIPFEKRFDWYKLCCILQLAEYKKISPISFSVLKKLTRELFPDVKDIEFKRELRQADDLGYVIYNVVKNADGEYRTKLEINSVYHDWDQSLKYLGWIENDIKVLV